MRSKFLTRRRESWQVYDNGDDEQEDDDNNNDNYTNDCDVK